MGRKHTALTGAAIIALTGGVLAGLSLRLPRTTAAAAADTPTDVDGAA